MAEYQKIRPDEDAPSYSGGGLMGLLGESSQKMSGWLHKMSRGKGMFSTFSKKWDKRFFVLENQSLRYYENEFSGKPNNLKGEVHLLNAKILTDVSAHTGGKSGHFFGISLDNGATCELLIEAPDAASQIRWKEAIENSIKTQPTDFAVKNFIREEINEAENTFSAWCGFLDCFGANVEEKSSELSEWAEKYSRSRRMFSFLYRNWKKRFFVVKDGKIMYYEFHEEGHGPTGYKGFLSLYGATLIPDAEKFSNGSDGVYLGLSLDNGVTCELLLKVDDSVKRTKWCRSLRGQIEFAKANPTISNALPGEDISGVGVVSDKVAAAGIMSMNRMIDFFVQSAPRNNRSEDGFADPEQNEAFKSMDRDEQNDVENTQRLVALDSFSELLKSKPGGERSFSTVPTCFVFSEPAEDETNQSGIANPANDPNYKTSKEYLIKLLEEKEISGKKLGCVVLNEQHEFIGKNKLSFVVVAWYSTPLDVLAKRQNQTILLDKSKIAKIHEEIRSNLNNKSAARAHDGSLIYSTDKYHLPPTDKFGLEFEGVKLYESPYEYIHTSYSMGRVLEDSLGALQDRSEVFELKKINLALDSLNFFYDFSIQKGQLVSYFPLHKDIVEVEEKFTTGSILALPWDYDITAFRDYFGELIGFQFRFAQHFTVFLSILAVLGVFMQIWIYSTGRNEGPGVAMFAGIVIFWGELLIANWEYQVNTQSFEWGMDNFNAVARVRPAFKESVVVHADSQDKELMDMSKSAQTAGDAYEDEEDKMDNGVLFSFTIPLIKYEVDVPKLYCCWRTPKDVTVDSDLSAEGRYSNDLFGWIQFKIAGMLMGGADTVHSPVDGHPEYVYRSRLNHTLRNWIAIAVMFLSAGVVVACTFGVYYLRAYMSTQPQGILKQYNSKITSFLNNAQTAVFAPAFNYIMLCMNDFENHRTINDYNNALVMKKSCIIFVNTFFSYYYIAFVERNMVYYFGDVEINSDNDCAGYATCMGALTGNLWAAIFLNFIVLVKTKIEIPIKNFIHNLYVKELTSLAHYVGQMLFHAPLKPQKDMLEVEGNNKNNFIREVMKQYAHRANSGSYTNRNLFDSYTKLFVTFGYMCLFLPALPVVSVIAFFTTWADMKIDAEKLIDEFLRPFPSGSYGMGAWRQSFNVMAVLAIPTNVGVVVFTMNSFGVESFSTKLIIFVIMQWVVLILLYFARLISSGEALKVTIQKERTKIIIENLEQFVSDRKLARSDNALRDQISLSDQLKNDNKSLQTQVREKDAEIAKLKKAAADKAAADKAAADKAAAQK